jgi:hypothetical protein
MDYEALTARLETLTRAELVALNRATARRIAFLDADKTDLCRTVLAASEAACGCGNNEDSRDAGTVLVRALAAHRLHVLGVKDEETARAIGRTRPTVVYLRKSVDWMLKHPEAYGHENNCYKLLNDLTNDI